MKNTRVARRYAQALLESAEEGKVLEGVLKDVGMLQRTIEGSKELRSFLKSPVIKGDTKMTVLKTLFETVVGPLTMNFLFLLVNKKREDVLPEIIGEMLRLSDERQGIVTLELRAATDLSEDHKAAIASRFEKIVGKSVRVRFSVDGSLKGGVVARLGDTVYDGSVRRQLDKLRDQFASGVVSN